MAGGGAVVRWAAAVCLLAIAVIGRDDGAQAEDIVQTLQALDSTSDIGEMTTEVPCMFQKSSLDSCLIATWDIAGSPIKGRRHDDDFTVTGVVADVLRFEVPFCFG